MILISHRGNLTGKEPEKENHPDHIWNAMLQGFHVEVDVWYIGNKFKLGHDKPQYDFPFELVKNHSNRLWLHCKNIEAMVKWYELDRRGIHVNYFWHQKDDVILTSKGYLWAYPGKDVDNSIAVLPEIHKDNISNRIGICSDEILNYR